MMLNTATIVGYLHNYGQLQCRSFGSGLARRKLSCMGLLFLQLLLMYLNCLLSFAGCGSSFRVGCTVVASIFLA